MLRKFCQFICLVPIMVAESAALGESCVSFPEGEPEPVATFCETATSYSFDLAGDQLAFAKEEFHARLNHGIRSWWAGHGFEQADLDGSAVDVWLSIPEANPQAAQARAIVFGPSGNVSLAFDLHGDDWNLSDHEAAILDQRTYPETYGWRPQQVLVSLTANASIEAAAYLLRASGLTLEKETSPGWYLATSEVFDESASIQRIARLDQGKKTIQSAQLNKLFEWIAVRGKTVHFNMDHNTK